jgi:hypothetical protein
MLAAQKKPCFMEPVHLWVWIYSLCIAMEICRILFFVMKTNLMHYLSLIYFEFYLEQLSFRNVIKSGNTFCFRMSVFEAQSEHLL